jgi:hypothetical protein
MFERLVRCLGGMSFGTKNRRARSARVRPRLECLEDRYVPAPVTFTFQGRGVVPPGSGLIPGTAYQRFQVPSMLGDELDVFVQLSSTGGPAEPGEVLYDNDLFKDAEGHPLPQQAFAVLANAGSADGVSFFKENTDYSGTNGPPYRIPTGTGSVVAFTASWDGDESATIHMTLRPTFPRDVTSLFHVEEINRHQHVHGSHHLHLLPEGNLILTLTNNANLPATVPGASPNPTTVPLAIQGPLYVVLDGLPRSQKLVHPTGFTEDGRPYVEITPSGSDGVNNGVVDHGESLSLELRFKHRASGAPIRFTPEVWAGQNPP